METLELLNKFEDLVIVTIFILDLNKSTIKIEVTTNGVDNNITVNFTNFKQRQKLDSWLFNQFEEESYNEIIGAVENLL